VTARRQDVSVVTCHGAALFSLNIQNLLLKTFWLDSEVRAQQINGLKSHLEMF
jgi:hypothetical protein